MTTTDYPLSLNPAYMKDTDFQRTKWTREVIALQDKGEGYTTLVTFWLRHDWTDGLTQIEIMNVLATGVSVQPSERQLLDTAKAGLEEEFGKIEFV